MIKIKAKESNGVDVKARGRDVSYLEMLAILDNIFMMLKEYDVTPEEAIKDIKGLNEMCGE